MTQPIPALAASDNATTPRNTGQWLSKPARVEGGNGVRDQTADHGLCGDEKGPGHLHHTARPLDQHGGDERAEHQGRRELGPLQDRRRQSGGRDQHRPARRDGQPLKRQVRPGHHQGAFCARELPPSRCLEQEEQVVLEGGLKQHLFEHALNFIEPKS